MPHNGRDRRLVKPAPATVLLFPARGGSTEPCADLSNTYHHCVAYLLYLSPSQDPRRAWATTLKHSTSLDQGKAGAFNTLDDPSHPTWGSAHFYSYHHAVD